MGFRAHHERFVIWDRKQVCMVLIYAACAVEAQAARIRSQVVLHYRADVRFFEDAGLEPRFRSRLEDYRNSGYDRGHLVRLAKMCKAGWLPASTCAYDPCQ